MKGGQQRASFFFSRLASQKKFIVANPFLFLGPMIVTYLLGLTNAKTSGLILGDDDLVISTEEHELGTSDLDTSGGEVGPSRGNGGDLLQKANRMHKIEVSVDLP